MNRNRSRRVILLRRPSKDVGRIASATRPRRRGRPRKNASALVQGEFDFVEDKVGRYWDCCALVTNDGKLDAASLAQIYRDRGDCENNFDEYKNQYGWAGIVRKACFRSHLHPSAEEIRAADEKPLPKQRKRPETHCLKRRFASSNCRI